MTRIDAPAAPRRLPLACAAVCRVVLLVLLLGAWTGTAAPAAHATAIGLSDQQPTSWSDPRLRALGLRYARLIVPWDAVASEPAIVQAWLDQTAAAGMEPHVAFEHLKTDHCPGAQCVLPTVAQYRAAVGAFIARWPQVRTYTTWNEANHPSQPVANRPDLVAQYWQQLVAACPGCTVVAGDVLDSGDFVGWLRQFEAAAAPATPQLWGLHNYGDVTYGTTSGTDDALAAVPGQLWIEETGGIVTLRNAQGRITLSTNQTRAAQSIDRAFAIAATRPRITRMYVYQWKPNGPYDAFDSGLLNPDGTIRPSYTTLLANLQRLATASAASSTATTAAVVQPRATVRWSGSKLVLTLTCPTGKRCRGKVTPTIRTQTTKTAKARTVKLAAHTYATTAKTRTTRITLKVGAVARARVRRAVVRQLAITFAATLPAKTTTVQTLKLKRP
ncbi:MAG: glycosyl hydrolase [Solirubrobacteraceae bacterium]|nr:hypothetical protein [Patulibacter sp.]